MTQVATAPATTAPPAEASQRTALYLPALDGLRFLAFLAVFCQHALPARVEQWLALGVPAVIYRPLLALGAAGGFGVDLFFCLSSFLITTLLLREIAAFGTVDVPRFLARRALRIWPLYFAFLAFATLPFLQSRLPPVAAAYFALFSGNWWCVLNGFPKSVSAPLWSVSVEEQFYLVWPWLIRRRPTASQIRVLACAMIALSCVVRALLIHFDASHTAIACNTFARLDPIAFGALLATWPRLPLGGLSSLGRGTLASAALLALLALPPLTALSALAGVLVYAITGATSALLVALALTPASGQSWLSRQPLVYLGKISYGLYVFHMLGLKIAGSVGARLHLPALQLLMIPIAFAVSIGLAAASYRFLEAPFLRLKSRLARVESRPI